MNGLDFGTAIGLIKGLGSPDPAVIESAVSDWLDDHPEATTTVQDGSITKAKLDSNLQGTVDDVANLKSQINIIDDNTQILNDSVFSFAYLSTGKTANGWKLTDDGSFARDADYKIIQYPVAAGETVFIWSNHIYKFETAMSGATVGNVVAGNFKGFDTVPTGATYIAVSMLAVDNYGLYSFSNTSDAKCEKARILPIVDTSVVDGFLDVNGKFIETDNFNSRVTDKIKCKAGDVFYYFGNVYSGVVTVMFYDLNGEIVGYGKPTSGVSGLQHMVFTAPANADTAVFTSYNAGVNPNPLTLTMVKDYYQSPLSLKKWFACGDSFTAGGYGDNSHVFEDGKYIRKQKVYPYFIGNRTNCDVKNIAVAGMTLATKSGLTVCFTDTNYTTNYTNISSDADIVTLWFGINDSGNNIPIGDIDDTVTTTFYGAYNTVIEYIITNCPKAHIGIIVSNSLNSAFVDATIAIAKKWGIPYLDLNYDNSIPLMSDCIRPDASAAAKALRNQQYYISEENHHPNALAHEYESYFIEKWLLSL